MTGKQRKQRVILTKDERYCNDCIQHRFYSGRTSFSVWAAVGWDWKSELVILDSHGRKRGMSMADHKHQVLDAHVIPYFAIRESNVEDGNKARGSKNADMQRYKAERSVTCIENWPPSYRGLDWPARRRCGCSL